MDEFGTATGILARALQWRPASRRLGGSGTLDSKPLLQAVRLHLGDDAGTSSVRASSRGLSVNRARLCRISVLHAYQGKAVLRDERIGDTGYFGCREIRKLAWRDQEICVQAEPRRASIQVAGPFPWCSALHGCNSFCGRGKQVDRFWVPRSGHRRIQGFVFRQGHELLSRSPSVMGERIPAEFLPGAALHSAD